jgi:aminomethyltransferase
MRETKLHDWHVRAGARMTEFSGWDMPVLYPTGPREEHMRVRAAAGLFDIDHMGRFLLSGPSSLDFLQGVQTWDASRIKPGHAHYSLLPNDAGGIIDDIFIYRFEEGAKVPGLSALKADRWLVVVNAGNRDRDFGWLSRRVPSRVKLEDASDATCMIALQGPASRSILQKLANADLAGARHHRILLCPVAGADCILCTSGYTGEPGFEIMIPAHRARGVWEAIIEAGSAEGLIPCGLAARDTLRAEACLPLYGHEITETTDPFTSGLDKAALALDGHDFIGKAALVSLSKAPPSQRLVGLEMEKPAVPRQGYPIASGGRTVGSVTTGLFSPSTGRYVAMGYVEAGVAEVGRAVEVIVREEPKAARIVERPFYRSPHWAEGK